MDSARAARRERSHRAHSWLSLTMAPTLHSTLYLNSLDPRGKIHTIHASTKAPNKDPSLWQQPLRQRRGLSSPQTRFGRRSLRSTICGLESGAEKRDRCACGQPGG